MGIEDVLDDRKRSSSGDLPPFWNPEEQKKIFGQVTEVRPSSFKDGDLTYHLTQENGITVTLPNHTVLMNRLKNDEVGIGHWVLAEFEEKTPTKSDFDVFLYNIATMSPEEAKEHGQEDVKEVGREDDVDASEEEVVTFAKEILSHFDGEMPEEEFDNYLNNVRKFDKTPKEVAKMAGFTIKKGIVKSE